MQTKFPKYEFILASFGLQFLKPAIYSARIGDVPLKQNAGYSYLGTPVFDNIILDINDIGLRIDKALCDVSMTKNIVKTSIQGLNGTIKEYISDGDFNVSIKGVLFSEDNTYPQSAVNSLIELCKRAEPLQITGAFINQFGIDEIVIENYSFPQKEGFENLQMFELNCVSDKPAELIISD